METLFYKYPETIGEELEAQIKYAKSIGTIRNNQDLSLEMRKLEKEVFGEKRKYTAREDGGKIRGIEKNTRPAVITELKRISKNQEISNYFLLFSAFKSLKIIKEDYNIIKLFDFYRIKPKKEVDKERLEKLKNDFEDLILYNFAFHTKCSKEDNQKCEHKEKCVFIKIKNIFNNIPEDEQIKILYELGLPSNLMAMNLRIYGMYYISLETLKKIVKKFGEKEFIKYIEEEETKFNETMKNWKERKKRRYGYVMDIEQEILEQMKSCREGKNANGEEIEKLENDYIQIGKLKKNIEKRNTLEDKVEKTREYKKMIYNIKKYSNGLFGKYNKKAPII